MRVAVVVVSAALAGGCVPFAAPPLRVDVGGAFNTGRAAVREKLSIGAHVASAWHEPNLPLDIGVGYVRNGFASHDARDPDPLDASPKPRRAVPQGFYLEAGPRVAGGEYWRAFVTSRVEMFAATQSELVGVGFLARANAEVLYPVETQPVAGATRKGVFFGVAHGMLALGAYAEAGYQRWPTGETGAVIGIGLSARLPGGDRRGVLRAGKEAEVARTEPAAPAFASQRDRRESFRASLASAQLRAGCAGIRVAALRSRSLSSPS